MNYLNSKQIEKYFVDFDLESSYAITKNFYNEFIAPRDIQLVSGFLNKNIKGNSIVFAGAGSHTKEVIEKLSKKITNSIVGIVDRKADDIKSFEHFDVIPFSKLKNINFDYIIVGHQEFEREMIDEILKSGIDKERIISIYTNPRFQDFAINSFWNEIETKLPEKIDFLVITSGRLLWSVINDQQLSTIFQHEKTLNLFIGRKQNFQESEFFKTINVKQSWEILFKIIKKLKPKAIYIKTSYQHKNQILPVLVKKQFENIKVIHEPYDWALTIDDPMLLNWDFDKKSMNELRYAEVASCNICDLIITKNGGKVWEKTSKNINVPNLSCIPKLPISSTINSIDKNLYKNIEKWKIMYASTLPVKHFLNKPGLLQGFYDIFHIFERLNKQNEFYFEIYNSSHRNNGMESNYAHYYEMENENIKYNKGIPFENLVKKMENFHFGWLILNREGKQSPYIDYVTIPNRFIGFVMGNLPVIVEEDYCYVADLVKEFNAGLVFKFEDIYSLPELLKEIDYLKLKKGVLELKKYIFNDQSEKLKKIKNFLFTQKK